MIQKHYLHLPVHYVKMFNLSGMEPVLQALHFCDDNASTKYNYDDVSKIVSL